MKNTNVSSKDSNLVPVLKEYFEGKLNLARIKFISLFVIALTKVRTVSFENLARALDTRVLHCAVFNGSFHPIHLILI